MYYLWQDLNKVINNWEAPLLNPLPKRERETVEWFKIILYLTVLHYCGIGGFNL